MKNFDKILDSMTERRRDFHRYPETGWTEFRTTSLVAQILESLGFSLRFASDFINPEDVMGRSIDVIREKKRALEQGGDAAMLERMGDFTGLIADFDTGRPGPITALRFDIDCVDTTESTDANHRPHVEGFASVNSGAMHSCGHDGHTALGLALAEMIAQNPDDLKGTIRLVFQPAEEGVRGGYAFAQAGVVDDADYFIALHLGLGFPTGTLFGGTEGFLCTSKFDVMHQGFGAHAGGEPQKGRNALLGAASAALAFHGIAPSSQGITRLNVGVLRAGEGRNVIAPKAEMKIETRGETEELASYVYDRAMEIIDGSAKMYGLDVEVRLMGKATGGTSDTELVELICQSARCIKGFSVVEAIRTMTGSDDATWLMQRVQQHGGLATYIGLGATIAAGHHNSSFDFDEAALPLGLELLWKVIHRLAS